MNKIKKMSLVNVACFTEKVIEFNSLMTLIGPNGIGKTTILRAINVALSGDFPRDLVREGESVSSVVLELADGFCVGRYLTEKGTFESRIGFIEDKTLKKVSKEAATAEVARHLGLDEEGDTSNLKVIASPSRLSGMTPDELSKFITDAVPCASTVNDVLAWMAEDGPVPDGMKELVTTYLPAGKFGMADVDAAYKKIEKLRKELSSQSIALKARAKAVTESKFRPAEDIKADINAVLDEVVEATNRLRIVQEYANQKAERTRILTRLHELKERYQEMKASCHEPVEGHLAELESILQNHLDMLTVGKEAIATMKANADSLTGIIASLKKGICPQMAGMKCPHDWSGTIADLEAKRGASVQQVQKMMAQAQKCEVIISRDREAIKAEQENASRYAECVSAFREFSSLKPSLRDLPEDPGSYEDAQTVLAAVKAKQAALQKELDECYAQVAAVKAQEELEELTPRLELLTRAAKGFAPKGAVRNGVLRKLVGTLEEGMADSASSFGRRIRLEVDGGLQLSLSHGDGAPFVRYAQLSKGEQTMAAYLLTLVLNELCGVGIVMVDNVEALDDASLTAMVKEISAPEVEWRHIIFAGAYHKGIEEILQKAKAEMNVA